MKMNRSVLAIWASMAAAWFAVGGSLSAQVETLRPYYERSYYESTDRSAVGIEIAAIVTEAKLRSADFATFTVEAGKRKDLLAEAFSKRLEIFGRLIDYVESNSTGSGDSYLYARQGGRELREMIRYFDQEIARSSANAVATPLEINVSDLGAKGDGIQDDGPALRMALDQAQQHGGPVRIRLPKGRYLVRSLVTADAPPASMTSSEVLQSWGLWRDVHLALVNQKDLTIVGDGGVTLLCGEPTRTAISVLGCRNVYIKNIAIDYEQLPFTQGTIIDLDLKSQSIVWKKDEGYPDPTLPNFLNAVERRGLPYSGKTGRVDWSGNDKFLGSVEDVGGGKFRVEIKRGTLSALARGKKFAMIARFDGSGSAINIRSSSYCTLENVAIYSSPGIAFMAGSSTALNLVDCVVEPLPNSGRVMSSNGDGFQYTNGVIGPFVKGCRFTGMHDDGFMISTRCAPIRSTNEDRTLLVTTPGLIRAGDEIAILSATEGTVKSETRVKAVVEDVSRGEVTLENAVPEVQTMDGLGMKELGHREMHEYYTGGRKFSALPDYAINLNLSNSATVVIGNIFSEHRGVGIKIQAPNAIAEDNVVSGIQSIGIAVSSILTWREPFAAHNVVIRNNRIADVPIGFATHYTLAPGKDAECVPLRGLSFTNNEVKGASKIFMNLENCQDVRIADNRVERCKKAIDINIGRAMHVTLDGNSFAPENKEDAAK